MTHDIDYMIRAYGGGETFRRWLRDVWATGFGQGGKLVEALPGADPGYAAQQLLRAAEEAGWITRSSTPQPTTSQRAFLGLQYRREIPAFHAEAFGWMPNRDSAGLRDYLDLAEVLQGRPYAELQREVVRRPPAGAPVGTVRPAPTRSTKPKARTYQDAQREILAHLRGEGWAVKTDLKEPHATDPRGTVRLWFKPQAVYAVEAQAGRFDRGEARSLFVPDLRQLDGPAFLREIAPVTRRW
jgi:hypothetical protein